MPRLNLISALQIVIKGQWGNVDLFSLWQPSTHTTHYKSFDIHMHFKESKGLPPTAPSLKAASKNQPLEAHWLQEESEFRTSRRSLPPRTAFAFLLWFHFLSLPIKAWCSNATLEIPKAKKNTLGGWQKNVTWQQTLPGNLQHNHSLFAGFQPHLRG